MSLVLGIDPGKQGGVVVIDDALRVIATERMDNFLDNGSGRGKKDYLERDMDKWLARWFFAPAEGNRLAVLERQHAMPGQGVTSMFSLGVGFGLWRGLLAGLGIPIEIVHPSVWTRVVLAGAPGDGKERAVGVARRRLPDLDLCPGSLRKPHRGLADAACLALYGFRVVGVGGDAGSSPRVLRTPTARAQRPADP